VPEPETNYTTILCIYKIGAGSDDERLKRRKSRDDYSERSVRERVVYVRRPDFIDGPNLCVRAKKWRVRARERRRLARPKRSPAMKEYGGGPKLKNPAR